MRGPDRVERLERARLDLGRRSPDVLEPERDLRLDAREHHLVLRVLEQRPDGSRELGGANAASVEPGHLDPAGERAAVEVRDEPRKGAQQRRLPAPRRPEQRRRPHPARSPESSSGVHRARRDSGTSAPRPSLEPQRPHRHENHGRDQCEPVEHGPRRPRRPRCAGEAVASRLHRLRKVERPLERPGQQRRRAGAHARARRAPPARARAGTRRAPTRRARAWARAAWRARS